MERLAREKAERELREETERLAREKAERELREEGERRERENTERQVREEHERRQREDDELREREETERRVREQADRIAHEEAERRIYAALERRRNEEEERRSREESERRAREEAERAAREEHERRLREDIETRLRTQLESAFRSELEKVKNEAEQRTVIEAERRAREQAELLARDRIAQLERELSERAARDDAERRAREDAERKLRAEREEREREEAEQRIRAEAERIAREQTERADVVLVEEDLRALVANGLDGVDLPALPVQEQAPVLEPSDTPPVPPAHLNAGVDLDLQTLLDSFHAEAQGEAVFAEMAQREASRAERKIRREPVQESADRENSEAEELRTITSLRDDVPNANVFDSKFWQTGIRVVLVAAVLAAVGWFIFGRSSDMSTGFTLMRIQTTEEHLPLVQDIVSAWMASEGIREARLERGDGNAFAIAGRSVGDTVKRVEIRVARVRDVYASDTDPAADCFVASTLSASDAGALRSTPAFFPTQHVLALDGICVVVHPRNSLRAIRRSDAIAALTGVATDWAMLGGARAPLRLVLAGDTSLANASLLALLGPGDEISPRAQQCNGTAEVLARVAADPRALGFVRFADRGNARVLPVIDAPGDPVAPSVDAIRLESYPLTARLCLYVSPATAVNPRSFIDFAMGVNGQNITAAHGYADLSLRLSGRTADRTAPAEYVAATKGAKRVIASLRLRPGASELDALAFDDIRRLKMFSDITNARELLVVGICDRMGARETEILASRTLAQMVKARLKETGIKAHSALGMGAIMPVADEKDDGGRNKNRRVEIWVR
ncbi:MAG: hypothetical protein IPP94_12020 [Ignavibacteria bacterium]|nr:hypothetical protein [Ignavibacteria bacterium]